MEPRKAHYGHGNFIGNIKDEGFLDELSDYQRLKKNSAQKIYISCTGHLE
jgi:hypothetical protein